jgi:hypothetical protein
VVRTLRRRRAPKRAPDSQRDPQTHDDEVRP